jgi:hypothetical protein
MRFLCGEYATCPFRNRGLQTFLPKCREVDQLIAQRLNEFPGRVGSLSQPFRTRAFSSSAWR